MRLLLLISFILLVSCSDMKPEDFKNTKPIIKIEEYFQGSVKAWGILQDRKGRVTRQFKADLNGKWDGSQLILDEIFNWTDGEKQTRQWTIQKIDEHHYEGTASDESIKITIRFLTNEVRSDGIRIVVHKRRCNAQQKCAVKKISSALEQELRVAILKKAVIFEKELEKNKKKFKRN